MYSRHDDKKKKHFDQTQSEYNIEGSRMRNSVETFPLRIEPVSLCSPFYTRRISLDRIF